MNHLFYIYCVLSFHFYTGFSRKKFHFFKNGLEKEPYIEMSLWHMIPFPFISFDLLRLSDIKIEDMPYTIMQGIDEDGRFFLAQKVLYEGTLQVGFIIQHIPGEEEIWDYGLLGKMDTYVTNS